MRNRDRAAYYESNIECVHELCARYPGAGALFDVISDAIVAAQDDRSGQPHQFFGLFVERAVFVGLGIEGEESFDAEVVTAQQLLVHGRAILIELVHGIAFPFGFFGDCTTRRDLFLNGDVETRKIVDRTCDRMISFR